LPEIDSADRLDALVAAERAAGIAPAAIRRLAALLPVDPQVAAAVGARLRLSNKLAARLVAAAGTALDAPAPLAYRIGAAEAIDRILLHGQAGPEVKQLEDWRRPHLPVSGGDLIAMGLTAGPVVAKTMQALEEEWIAAGFPADKNAVRAMARRLVDQLLRSSQ
jgi:poly(A) polymerase